MGYNLAELPYKEMERVNVDLAASGVAFRERYNMPVIPDEIERQQPAHLRTYFRERVSYYREMSRQFATLPYDPNSK
ncbi:DNA polymerase III subunit theta [Dickeya solani]|uniref:DNA polymerase III, theta subunit n=1 Tax=Dickeya solani D s0432-1 TaxID=1231725 RepID=A0AAV3KEF0_9GAMM|nr:DNA polymerase III subunit theta [Dickeya solani]ANE77263.1 DNA polymerase III subunit theta [Dickeya solani IPO 2222]AUC40527.1 DNA polymerase III theta subunit [Dickeya solani RNS 08.23.3.1.A]AUH07327.1 DNA polymerase III subunit theta [Dickeya solani D s0432-1]AUH11371.1 DNA polymerase III subunit theta [Dickeya solani]AYQ47845.1 DNA polymerase III subunit theta [Dickeya solani]